MRHDPALRRTSLPAVVGCLLALMLTIPAQAQDCPFEPSEAVEDTLDPAGYYPVQIGNAWEYEQSVNGFHEAFIRVAVVGDTLVEGSRFFVREWTWFRTVGMDSVEAATSVSYIAVVDSGFVEPGGFEPHPFDADFNTCTGESSGNPAIVSGGYEQPTGVEGLDAPAVKTVENLGGSDTYAHGLGKVGGTGDGGGLQELTYLKVGDVEYGEPLRERVTVVAAEPREEGIPARAPHLTAHPNPVRGAATVTVELAGPGVVAVHVYDLLGRRVATPLERTLRMRGAHTARWSAEGLPAGLYFVVSEIDGRRTATARVVKL